MFLGLVTTKTIGKNRNDIKVIDNQGAMPVLPPLKLSLLCIVPLISEIWLEMPLGNVVPIVGLPPILVNDVGDTYTPLPAPVQMVAMMLPYPHWLINWTRNITMLTSPGYLFHYMSVSLTVYQPSLLQFP